MLLEVTTVNSKVEYILKIAKIFTFRQ